MNNGSWIGLLILLVLFQGCKPNSNSETSLIWSGERVVSLSIPLPDSLSNHAVNVLKDRIGLHLAGNPKRILGEYSLENRFLVFSPLIPFTPGLNYEIQLDNRLLEEIKIPQAKLDHSNILTIYPSRDSIPENLLKIYLQFDKPMQEGNALNYIHLLNSNGDTLQQIFLELRPELWNRDNTSITLWLDPGRIKRDLIPNQKLGNPISMGETLQLIVSGDWPDALGRPFGSTHTKNLIIDQGDRMSPDYQNWSIIKPPAHSQEPLKIDFKESLDFFLIKACFTILDKDSLKIPGAISVEGNEQILRFKPASSWTEETYFIRVATHLEDLAGNNLNRLFDVDLFQTHHEKTQDYVYLEFLIEN